MGRSMEYLGGPLHVARCFIELGWFGLVELVYEGDKALDCFPEDSPEDAAIPSSIPSWERAA